MTLKDVIDADLIDHDVYAFCFEKRMFSYPKNDITANRYSYAFQKLSLIHTHTLFKTDIRKHAFSNASSMGTCLPTKSRRWSKG